MSCTKFNYNYPLHRLKICYLFEEYGALFFRCGWLENGSAYFPSHSDSVECGSAIQINICSGGTQYDAYCTTVI